MDGKPKRPPARVSVRPMKLSGRPSVVRPARPNPPGSARPRPGRAPGTPAPGSVRPPGYGIPEWQRGIIKLQDVLANARRIRIKERVQAATSGGTPSQTSRNKGWQTRRAKYGKAGRKT